MLQASIKSADRLLFLESLFARRQPAVPITTMMVQKDLLSTFPLQLMSQLVGAFMTRFRIVFSCCDLVSVVRLDDLYPIVNHSTLETKIR